MPEQYRNGEDDTVVRRKPRTEPTEPAPIHVQPAPVKPQSSGFLAQFLGGFLAIFVLVAAAGIIYYVWHGISTSLSNNSSSADTQQTDIEKPAKPAKSKNLLEDSSAWRLGETAAKQLDGKEESDISWWTKTFYLPKTEPATEYLKSQGLTVGKIIPAHYEDTKDATTITYDVYAEVPAQLLKLNQVYWRPKDPELTRFTKVLVLNNGLAPGVMWDTQNPAVAAEAGTKLNFAWKVTWDKNYNSVTTDRLPLTDNVFTQQQVSGYQSEEASTLCNLQGQIQAITAQVQQETQQKLAQVPADPPKPGMKSTKWNHGDGSGEPTKSAERMGGSTVAGAAGGAAFGAVAGDAGMGAGIGAGVGLLGGFIYDTVSKNNDRHKYERRVASENEERMDDWRSQVKALNKQRDQIKKDVQAERQQQLDELATTIANNKGSLGAVQEPVAVSDAPQLQPVVNGNQPNANQPSSNQPSGPIQSMPPPDDAPDDLTTMKADTKVDLLIKKGLVGYWSSGKTTRHLGSDGILHGDPNGEDIWWDVKAGKYCEAYKDPTQVDQTYDIVSLGPAKFVFRPHGGGKSTTWTRQDKPDAKK